MNIYTLNCFQKSYVSVDLSMDKIINKLEMFAAHIPGFLKNAKIGDDPYHKGILKMILKEDHEVIVSALDLDICIKRWIL